MKLYLILTFIISAIFLSSIEIRSEENAKPVKHISSCEMDFNSDNNSDIALLIETQRGMELLILLNKNNKYVTHNFVLGKYQKLLECRYGKSVIETSAGRGDKKGRTYKTNGTYLLIGQPEGAQEALFWGKDKFHKVWVSD